MTPEAKQAIIELLAQIARQNGAGIVRVEVRGESPYIARRVRALISGCDLGVSCDDAGWHQDVCTATTDPTYARILDLWAQIVSAAKAMEASAPETDSPIMDAVDAHLADEAQRKKGAK